MSIPIKINKFSRSDINNPPVDQHGVAPKKRGRPRKVVPLEETPKEEDTQVTENPTFDAEEDTDFVQEVEQDNNFLADLHNTEGDAVVPYENDDPVTEVKPMKQSKKSKKSVSLANTPTEFSDIMDSKKPTAILGNRREALTKIREFKSLFPKELKDFKVKPNATQEELEQAINECETIVNCSTMDDFLNEILLNAIKVVENASSKTSVNMTGTSDALRNNPEFNRLCKLCYIKYRVFSSVPPELQLLLVVMSTAMICVQKNKAEGRMSSILDQPVGNNNQRLI